MRTFQTGDLPAIDRRLAATASLPTPTPLEETFNMLIACKSAVATFPLQVMLDSLATTHQPATWATAKGVCRDFMRVKNIGISFNCTDRDMVTRLGGLKLNICGRPFPIREYSEYSHLYWIDLTLANDTQAEDVWTYFDNLGEPPVMIKSTFDKNSIQSRQLTVYFATKEPPKCLMYALNDPVREIFIHGTGSDPCFVHHRITRYNKSVPLSIRAKRAQAPASARTQASEHHPTSRNNAPEQALEAQAVLTSEDTRMDSEQSESSDSEHSATSEDEDMGQSMERADSNPPTRSNSTNDLQHTTPYDDTASEGSADGPTVLVRANFVDDDPNRRVQTRTAFPDDSPLWYRAQLSRRYTSKASSPILLPQAISVDSVATDHPGIVVHAFPAHYNSFEVLEDADDEIDATPAPYIVTVDGNPNLYATHARSNANLQCYNAFNTDVESMTVGELTDYLEHYANSFQSEDDPSIALAMIQANPGHLAPILDVQTPKNIEVLVHKAPGHALQRFIQSHSYLDRIIDAMQEQANATLPQPLWAHLWPEAATSNNPTSLVLSSLVPNSANHSLVLALAQFCLFLQLNQPEIYFNAIKVSALVHQACHKHGGLPRLATLTLAPHFLWSDATLCALAASPMGDYLLTRSNLAIPIQQAIMVLATLHPLDAFTLPCYSA
ncbi:hypothetical protein DYB34_008775 [Aphanomyces astaci]|uniref:Uncharacterized protein n=1 Tax=Aphanomyces astaci TaxID=112090 RepID=A0A3R7A5Z0_APHAT|nr:hypothetical protein DYB34_008775 [Aphanomyces astaci]